MPTGIAALIESVGAVVMENVVDPVASAIARDAELIEDDGYDLAEEIAPYLTFKLDRYGGVEAEIPLSAADVTNDTFGRALGKALEKWIAQGKQGVWLKIPLPCAALSGAAAQLQFDFHHAKTGYLLMTRWLPTDKPSSLPNYSFTQIGVGGVVVNSRGEVLMVQERVSPLPIYQGSWKLPGGLADPGEDFADTVAREVREETGVLSSLVGVVSMRHTHNVRFGQGDLYVVVRLKAESEHITMDAHELMGAEWMSLEKIRSLVAPEGYSSLNGKVSANNWKMIENATSGQLIVGTKLTNSSVLYTAPPLPSAVAELLPSV